MPPRVIAFTKQVWEPGRIKEFSVVSSDTDEGIVIKIEKGVLNSIFIANLIRFLAKCQKMEIKVQIDTTDDLTKRSLEAIGVPKFAVLRESR